MKVLFLDIDGVLCTPRSYAANFNHKSEYNSWDFTSCSMIARICQAFDMQIVISSTWRLALDTTLEHMEEYFLIDYVYMDDPITSDTFMDCRGAEIDSWLERHEGEVEDYIVIDDVNIEDMGSNHIDNLIWVKDDMNGFGYHEYEQILKRYGAECISHEIEGVLDVG